MFITSFDVFITSFDVNSFGVLITPLKHWWVDPLMWRTSFDVVNRMLDVSYSSLITL